MPIVVDASCMSAMLLNEMVPPELDDLLRSLDSYEIVVPALWYWEIANSAVVAARRARIDPREIAGQFLSLLRLRITQDAAAVDLAWSATLDLAFKHRLTVYDAAYLELAVRLSLPLATLDRALARAARAEGIEVIGA